MFTTSRTRPVLLAVSSGGGHWVQLQRLSAAFDGARGALCNHPDATAARWPPIAVASMVYPDANKRHAAAADRLHPSDRVDRAARCGPTWSSPTGAAGGFLAIPLRAADRRADHVHRFDRQPRASCRSRPGSRLAWPTACSRSGRASPRPRARNTAAPCSDLSSHLGTFTMIFATVGTQLPFDRLLVGLDSWAALNPGVQVLAQCGESRRPVRHIETVAHLSQADFRARLQLRSWSWPMPAMGTILSASEMGKPIILMPRRAKFGEHRNEHQRDTAVEMARLSNVTVVEERRSVATRPLDAALARGFDTSATKGRLGQRGAGPTDRRGACIRLESTERGGGRSMTRATILIPAHNEAEVIGRTLWYLSRGLPRGPDARESSSPTAARMQQPPAPARHCRRPR